VDPWFPDTVAVWYDAFTPHQHVPEVDAWRHTRPRLVRELAGRFLADPHNAAAAEAAHLSTLPASASAERRYRLLQAASDAIIRAGVLDVVNYSSSAWSDIRLHWGETGNLLKAGSGLLLPRRNRRYGWQGGRPDRKLYDIGSHFEGFLRPQLPAGIDVGLRTTSGLAIPSERWGDRLRVAFAPTVMSMSDLRFEPIDEPSGRRSFRVVLKDPASVRDMARRVIHKAGEQGVDILLFPELCLTHSEQEALGGVLASASASHGGRPWLVVAGTSHAPRAGGSGHQNQAVVFHGSGARLLTHNKLFPYEISRGEADRYGIGEALQQEPRVEDIEVDERRIEILESPMGRLAVVICEDLANHALIGPLADALEIDWLLVPVMDGAQTPTRWTARYGVRYAVDAGVTTVVATCGALVEAHRQFELAQGRDDPGPGIGLVTRLSLPDASLAQRPDVTVASPAPADPEIGLVDLTN
jgi:predicted amidohydrolase